MKKAISAGVAVFNMPRYGEENMDPDFKGEPHVLLVEQYGRTWSIPKGHQEKDESLIETAIRETEEEVSLSLDDYEIMDGIKVRFQRESKGGPKEMKVIYQYMGITTEHQENIRICTPDKAITDYKWCTLKQAKKRLHKPDYKALMRLYTLGIWVYAQAQSVKVHHLKGDLIIERFALPGSKGRET